jgi:hypothetical protein
MTQPDTQLSELDPLAANTDVATALGVSDVSKLPTTMTVRMDRTLRRVSRRFRFEAQRIFTPGTYTHTVRIQGGAARLPEKPYAITRVAVQGVEQAPWCEMSSDAFPGLWVADDSWEDSEFIELPGGSDILPGDPQPIGPRFTVAGNWLYWNDWARWGLSGRLCQVTYVANDPVPQDVIDTVSAIVGRNLTVDPMSAVAQSKAIMTRHYRQTFADWVGAGNVSFTDEDIAAARAYRYPAPPMIVANMATTDTSPSAFFLSDSSW